MLRTGPTGVKTMHNHDFNRHYRGIEQAAWDSEYLEVSPQCVCRETEKQSLVPRSNILNESLNNYLQPLNRLNSTLKGTI